MTTWDEVEVGNHQFQIGGLESDPTTIAAETDVFTVSRSGLLIVHTGISAGPARVGVELHDSSPPADLDAWDNVAETTVSTTQELHVMTVDGEVSESLGPIPAPASRTLTVRVSTRGRAANWDHIVDDACEDYLIQAWPVDTNTPTRQLKSADGMWADAARNHDGDAVQDDPGIDGTADATVRLRGPVITATPSEWQVLGDDELVDEIDKLVAARDATDDLAIRMHIEVAAQELIDEALNRGITYPIAPHAP